MALYPIEKVILELKTVARKLSLEFDSTAATARRIPIAFALAEAVDGTEFVVNKMVKVELAARPWPRWTITMLVEIRDVLTVRHGTILAGSLFLGDAEEELTAAGYSIDPDRTPGDAPSPSVFFRSAASTPAAPKPFVQSAGDA